MSRYDGPRKLPAIAYCDATGEIVIGFSCPSGSVTIFKAEDADLVRKVVEPKARLAYDGVTFLVPGVPEAESQDEGMTALLAWRDWIHKHLPIEPGQTLRWRDYANREPAA